MRTDHFDITTASWRKSSYSQGGDPNNCIEVATNLQGFVPVRDSKAPHRIALGFSSPAWSAFVMAIAESSGHLSV